MLTLFFKSQGGVCLVVLRRTRMHAGAIKQNGPEGRALGHTF